MRRNTIHDTMKVIRSRCEINEETECFEWQGYLTHKRYGRIRYDTKWTEVHRATWQYHNGPIPDGMHVLHTCDNRKCCVPAHLYLGTNDQNIKDKMVRDRSGKKLDIARVKEIKLRLKEGTTHAELAEEFGVHPCSITRIATGYRWAHVTV